MAGTQAAGRKRLLVLGAGAGQLGLLEAARERGLFVVAVDRNPAAPGFRFADRRAIISVEDEPQIDRLAAAERVDGVIAPGIDWPVAIAARIAERHVLPHPIDPATAVLATSKLRQRERFAEAGVPHPRHVVCASLEEAAAAAADFGYPCVVKAPDRQGQKGLVLVRDEEQLADGFALALGESRSNVVLVEELIPGQEITVNGFSRRRPVHAADGHRSLARRATGLRRRARAHVAELARARAGRGGGRRRARGRRSRRSAMRGRAIRRSSSASAVRTWSSSRRASEAATTPSSARRCSAST